MSDQTRPAINLPRRIPIMPLPLPMDDERGKDGRRVILFGSVDRCVSASFRDGRWQPTYSEDHDMLYDMLPFVGWLPFPG